MRGLRTSFGRRPAWRAALAAWVLLLSLLPYVHQPLFHSSLADDLVASICAADGEHDISVAPHQGQAEECPVFGLLQVFGTPLATPDVAALPVPYLTVLGVVAAPSEHDVPAQAGYRPLQPRAPPFA